MSTGKTMAILFVFFLMSGLFLGCDSDEDSNSLTTEHEGWGNPGCWGSDCHTDDDTHNSELQPYECVDCHGKNGAPDGHGGATPCGDCHSEIHGKDGFPDPESCNACH